MNRTLEQIIKAKFLHVSNEELVKRANKAPDFGWDDEEYEMVRRMKETPNVRFEMVGNKIQIIES